MTMASLMADPDIEISAVDSNPIEGAGTDMAVEDKPMTHAVTIQRRTKDGHINIPNALQKYMGKKTI